MREAVAGEKNPSYIHGHTQGGLFSPTYHSWASMRSRCMNPAVKAYRNYGGRGIKVCDRWSRFENFLSDMGERPVGTSLERTDNDGDYSPENCRWAAPHEQAANKRSTVWVTVDGVRKRLVDWATELGISLNTVRARVRNQGMGYAEALTKPTRRQDGKLASGFAPGDPRNPRSREHKTDESD